MQPRQKTRDVPRIIRPAIAGLLLASFLFSAALAACPALHEYFHPDAGSPHHQCAVTLFTHGQLMTGDVAVTLAAVVLLLVADVRLPKLAEFSSADLRLAFGRAPPHCFRLP